MVLTCAAKLCRKKYMASIVQTPSSDTPCARKGGSRRQPLTWGPGPALPPSHPPALGPHNIVYDLSCRAGHKSSGLQGQEQRQLLPRRPPRSPRSRTQDPEILRFQQVWPPRTLRSCAFSRSGPRGPAGVMLCPKVRGIALRQGCRSHLPSTRPQVWQHCTKAALPGALQHMADTKQAKLHKS
eukprot:364041-Chlamydomonas_euryale.AAC.8